MRLPAGHAKRLFLGFTCSIMFLVVFALLIAHNSEAESSNISKSAVEDYPLTITIPTPNPEGTISFYHKLGFKSVEGLSGGLDVVRMEKEGTPYKLEIFHNRLGRAGSLTGRSFRHEFSGAESFCIRHRTAKQGTPFPGNSRHTRWRYLRVAPGPQWNQHQSF